MSAVLKPVIELRPMTAADLPAVMAIEAMVQAAMACVDRPEWPVLREVQFHSPLIVPEDSTVIMRTLALAAGEMSEVEYAAWLKANSRRAG